MVGTAQARLCPPYKTSRAVGAAAAVAAGVPAARAGVQPWLCIVAAAAAIGAAMPAGAAAAGDFDDVNRCRRKWRKRHRAGGAGGEQGAGKEGGRDHFVHV